MVTLDLLVALVFVGGLVALGALVLGGQDKRSLEGGSAQSLHDGRWQALHRTVHDVTHVLVVKGPAISGAEQQVLAEIHVRAADYETRLHQSMADARMRAAALNSELDG